MRIEQGGRTIEYSDSGGSGPPLVLLHGFPLDRTVWDAQARELSARARVIVPDLAGFGGTAPLPGGGTPSMDDYARDVEVLLDALDLPRAILGGVSMGGYVAFAFQRRAQRRLRGLVLVDTRAGPDSAEARAARDAAADLVRARGAPALAAQMLGRMLTPATTAADRAQRGSLFDLMAAQSPAGILAALAAIRDRPDSRPGLPGIGVPVLVVCGAEDRLIPPAESEAIRDAVPGARLALVPDAGHLPNLERPEAFNRILRDFLADLPPA